MAYCAYCGSWTDWVSPAPCTSCGKPTNGAPVPAFRSAESDSATAVTIIVLVITGFVVLGILAVIAKPYFVVATQQSSQKRTLASIRLVGALVESYGRDHNKLYPRAESMDELQKLLAPKYSREIPRFDAWGNDLRYGCTDDQCTGYAITSSGADRMFEHFYASKYPRSTTANFDCDIVWVNGEFRQYPEDGNP